MKWLFVLVVAGCYAQTPLLRFGSGKSAKEAEHDQAASMTPPALVTDREWTGSVETVKVRVYADEQFRAQNVHWREAFDGELAHANEVLGAEFGVRLVADYREWARNEPGETLEDALRELEQLDPARDVMTVIGLTSSLSLVSATFEQIGLAQLGGRHLVVRGYADVFERQMFDRAFHELSADEREAMYVARRRHKTTALLLHELGHTYGAPHTDVTDSIMSAIYSDRSSAFDAHSRDLIRATLDERLHRSAPIVAKKAAAIAHPTLVITLDAAGAAQIGGQPVDDTTLGELMKLSFDDDHETELIVRAPRETPQPAIVRVLDRAKAAGLHRLTLAR